MDRPKVRGMQLQPVCLFHSGHKSCPGSRFVRVDGVEYGRAFHRNLGEAKEEAARIALAEYKKKYGGS